MGLPYHEFKEKLLKALDPALGARDRREAEAALTETLKINPILHSPDYIVRFVKEVSDKSKDPLLSELAYAWSVPLLARIALKGALDTDFVIGAFKGIMQRRPSSATWRQLALALQEIHTPEALRLLRRIPVEEREKVLRDETLRATPA